MTRTMAAALCAAGLLLGQHESKPEQALSSKSGDRPTPSPSSRRVVRSSRKPIKINMPKLRNVPKFKKPKSM